MSIQNLDKLKIDPQAKTRPQSSWLAIIALVLVVTGVAAWFAFFKADSRRIATNASNAPKTTNAATAIKRESLSVSADGAKPSGPVADSVLTVSGYLVNRERIELSPRFMGVVKWIGVKKGDTVTNGQTVVLLDDAEYKARLREAQGRLSVAKANTEKARLSYERVARLALDKVESKQLEDDARIAVDSAKASEQEIEGQLDLIRTYIDWTIIKSPINGVVLEKLVDPNELVTPQSFGGTRGPSTALIAVADPKDLQVEIDLNEADLAKVSLNQKCQVAPEAYPDRIYEAYVAEIAPEANRQKGTLQIKVQIKNPDQFLTPELTAKVDFIRKP